MVRWVSGGVVGVWWRGGEMDVWWCGGEMGEWWCGEMGEWWCGEIGVIDVVVGWVYGGVVVRFLW